MTATHPDGLKQIVGAAHVLTGEAQAPYQKEWRGMYRGESLAVVRPGSVGEVSGVVAFAARHGLKIVPQGGNTGLVGGQVPFDGERAVVVSLERMDRIRSVDPQNNTITVDGGCILQSVQAAAREAGRLFPLSLASEGSCRIGGVLSTNAGGTAVVRYGSARDLVLGLEVVLADGRIWDGMTALRKDNTGYDLKQLFLGAEGTLGVITGAVLKTWPLPRSVVTGFAAVPDVAAAVGLFELVREAGGGVSAFEIMPQFGLELVTAHIPETRNPLAVSAPWYVLLELSSGRDEAALREFAERVLSDACSSGLAADAVIAASGAQAAALWHLRESLPDAQKPAGGSIKHDVSIPVSRMAAFIARAGEAVSAMVPGSRLLAFGHIGDGNVHFNVSQPEEMDEAVFLAHREEMNVMVHDIVAEMGGSISAEHGVGVLRRDENARRKGAVASDLMRRVKRALDPDDIFNPGKLVPPAGEDGDDG